MKKGCMYWFFIGFWLEPMIYIFKIIFMMISEILKSIAKISFNNHSYNINKDFDFMDGHEFEYFCAELLRKNGFIGVKVTQGSGDHGIDILARKDGKKYAIQCKCYSNNVGNKAVQEAYSGKDIYGADMAVVMTNRYYTKQAKIDAGKLGVELWDRNKLTYFIRNAKGKREKEEGTESQNTTSNGNESRQKSINKKWCGILICIVFILGIIDAILGESVEDEGNVNKRGIKRSSSVWLEGYTNLDEFEYYVDGNEIFLTDFDSREKKVRINSTYKIDGNIYHVVSLDGAFTLGSVTSVIIPEGVRSISNHEFNSCGIKFLYLPSTLQDIGDDTFWWYFHNVEKIYYGGSEEQWNQLCAVERSEIEVKQIIFDANPNDLK